MSERELVIRARLSAQRAFLGEVPPAMRAAVLSVDGNDIEVRCYFDGAIAPADIESVSVAETEMMADFEPEHSVGVRCIRLDAPEPITDDGVWIYFRRERTT
ncbi:hypothetical protein HPC49_13400 [Pyxidicoccus fallax]|uniref:Uncharacterized protein n=1 Tax=Pyxidicoccus fallax TaxID=394095 RepID=A0A848LE50_9BACT|nr:hypothetical protein [Pyxidicoccus fallax]NMO16664.1 hypothetical protein [Pyxidicoccus fallax]NPC79229.1 hypothetical protein [Pyxidicoccus fallax]